MPTQKITYAYASSYRKARASMTPIQTPLQRACPCSPKTTQAEGVSASLNGSQKYNHRARPVVHCHRSGAIIVCLSALSQEENRQRSLPCPMVTDFTTQPAYL